MKVFLMTAWYEYTELKPVESNYTDSKPVELYLSIQH